MDWLSNLKYFNPFRSDTCVQGTNMSSPNFGHFFCPVRKKCSQWHTQTMVSLCKRLFVIWRYSGGCTISHISFVENTEGAVVYWYWVGVPSARFLRTGHSYSGESIDCPLDILNRTYVTCSVPTRVPSKYRNLFAWWWTMDCVRHC